MYPIRKNIIYCHCLKTRLFENNNLGRNARNELIDLVEFFETKIFHLWNWILRSSWLFSNGSPFLGLFIDVYYNFHENRLYLLTIRKQTIYCFTHETKQNVLKCVSFYKLHFLWKSSRREKVKTFFWIKIEFANFSWVQHEYTLSHSRGSAVRISKSEYTVVVRSWSLKRIIVLVSA